MHRRTRLAATIPFAVAVIAPATIRASTVAIIRAAGMLAATTITVATLTATCICWACTPIILSLRRIFFGALLCGRRFNVVEKAFDLAYHIILHHTHVIGHGYIQSFQYRDDLLAAHI
jgi:hypothetical protein